MIITILTVAAIFLSSETFADSESMHAMPILKESKSYLVPSKEAGENLHDQRGFGDKDAEVSMMNLMMVEGSGYEGMDMNDMKKEPAKMTGMQKSSNDLELDLEIRKSPAVAKIGPNIYEFSIKDKAGRVLTGIKLSAQVYMLNMDMGTEKPSVREVRSGLYQTKASFSMAGPWALKIIAPAGEKVIEVKVEK